MRIMKKIFLFTVVAAALCACLTGCRKDSLSSTSVFPDEPVVMNNFDKWLYTNFTAPYNVRFIYRYDDAETDNSYNLVPPVYEKAIGMAVLIRENWVNTYIEAVDSDFVKTYCPRIYQLLGSNEYNSQHSKVLGTAEGGLKITLFGVNDIDLSNLYINLDKIDRDPASSPLDLNYWYFHTMHHEFCHILTQKVNYDMAYREISAGEYHSADWVNVGYEQAWVEGFVSGYGSGEYNEDFAEMYSTYVTSTKEAWDAMLKVAAGTSGDYGDGHGAEKIENKLKIVREYFKGVWNIDIDQMRDIVLAHSRMVVEKSFDLPDKVESIKAGNKI